MHLKRNSSLNPFHFLSLALCAAAMLVPVDSHATYYECQKRHFYSWWSNDIQQSSHSSVMSFDDETGVFWFNVGVTHGGTKLPIKQKFNANGTGNLVAATENKWGDEVLIIKHLNPKDEIAFVFMTENGSITGTCEIPNHKH